MLTGNLVRVRYGKNHLIAPVYIDHEDGVWLEVASRLAEIYRGHAGKTRGELEAEIDDVFGDSPHPQVYQGLAKLLEDRCEFAVVSGRPPDELREAVFQAAAEERRGCGHIPPGPGDGADSDERPGGGLHLPRAFDREKILRRVAAELGLPPEEVERGLFADLKSEQQLVSFKDTTPERLLQRYNVALAQAVLLRAASVEVVICGEPPRRYRQLLRLVKFHRLICEVEPVGPEAYQLRLDGPLSLFSATQKYGLQLALFLPAVLNCADFELRADVRWGPQRAAKKFTVTHRDRLVSHHVDTGMYVPPEMAMFVELFPQRVKGWQVAEETDVIPLGDSFWVPDYRLIREGTGEVVYLEVLGFWRRGTAVKHLERLREHADTPFVLAVSDQLHVGEAELEGLPGSILKFRQMPLAKDVVKAAEEALGLKG